MMYKVDVSSTQTFPNGDILNGKEECFFDEYDPLDARKDAFDYLLSLAPKADITLSIALSFCDESCAYDELCSRTVYPLDEYDDVITEDDFYLCFEVKNLHKERASYEAEKYYLGGSPIVLNDFEVFTDYDGELDEEIEVPAKILSANRRFFKMSGDLQRTG